MKNKSLSVVLTLAGLFAPATISTTDAAVIRNPGFEDPTHTRIDGTDPDNWTVIESGTGDNPDRQVRTSGVRVRSGDMSLALGAGQSEHDGELWQAVTTVVSQEYRFSIWARVGKEDEFDPQLQGFTVHLRDGGGTGGSVLATVGSSGDLTETYKEYTVDFSASSPTTTIHIVDSATAVPTDSNDTILDDVSMSEIPEPSTLALAAFGLLGLRRRRRK